MCTDSAAQSENNEEDNADNEYEGILLKLLECQGAAYDVTFQVFWGISNAMERCPKWLDSKIVASVMGESSSAASGDAGNDEDGREKI